MIANLLIGIGVFTGTLGLLDGILLSDKQKKYLADRFLELWNWLDDARRGSLYKFLSRAWVRWIGIFAGSGFVLWRASLSIIGEPKAEITITSIDGVPSEKAIIIPRDPTISVYLSHWLEFLLVFTLLLIACWLSALLIVRLLKRPLAASFMKASSIAIAIYVTGYALLDLSSRFAERVNPDGPLHVSAVVLFDVFVPAGLIVISPILLFYIVLALLLFAEFLVRRIAEQPKGPLAAFSGIVTAVGGILKAFV